MMTVERLTGVCLLDVVSMTPHEGGAQPLNSGGVLFL